MLIYLSQGPIWAYFLIFHVAPWRGAASPLISPQEPQLHHAGMSKVTKATNPDSCRAGL